MELCVARAGGTWRAMPKGLRVCQFIVQWMLLSQLEGRPITVPEYRRFYDEPERTAYRHLAEFRELFGEKFNGYSDPQPLVDILTPQMPPAQSERIAALRELRDRDQRKVRARDLDVAALLSMPVAM
jgi:hypothetical protein